MLTLIVNKNALITMPNHRMGTSIASLVAPFHILLFTSLMFTMMILPTRMITMRNLHLCLHQKRPRASIIIIS